jgi:hypothetical protein
MQGLRAGVDKFTEVKVIHSGTMQYIRPDVKINPFKISGSSEVSGIGQKDIFGQPT